jgi:hypothetical protein
LIPFFENNIGLITLLTFSALMWYAWETKKIASQSTKALKFNENKEKNDRTIFFLEKLSVDRLENILQRRNEKKEYQRDLVNMISFLNTVGLFYIKNKLNKEIISQILYQYVSTFYFVFHREIFNLLTTQGFYGNDFNYYESFLDLVEVALKDSTKRAKQNESTGSYKSAIDSISKIRKNILK